MKIFQKCNGFNKFLSLKLKNVARKIIKTYLLELNLNLRFFVGKILNNPMRNVVITFNKISNGFF